MSRGRVIDSGLSVAIRRRLMKQPAGDASGRRRFAQTGPPFPPSFGTIQVPRTSRRSNPFAGIVAVAFSRMKLARAAVDHRVRCVAIRCPPATRIPLRILTITVLILSIGIVAALPFRRTAVPESTAESVVANPEPLVAQDLVVDPWPWVPETVGAECSPPTETPFRDAPGAVPRESDRLSRAEIRRTAGSPPKVPASPARPESPALAASPEPADDLAGRSPSRDGYEAWMIPIDESPLLRQRFAATMVPESDGASARPTADGSTAETPSGGAVAWKTVSLDRSAPGPDQDDEPWVKPPSDPSYSFTPARDDTPSRPASERHWIRQPADR